MAPNGDAVNPCGRRKSISGSVAKPPPPKLSKDSLHRTLSDISFELMSREAALEMADATAKSKALPTISEVENAKCECCGMSEECTVEYIERVRDKFLGKWICGLCSEAVKEEMAKNADADADADAKKKLEAAMNTHMSACVRFNKLGRAYPALFQAEAMREMLRKRAKSISPKGPKPGIARSSSCIPAITRDINNLSLH